MEILNEDWIGEEVFEIGNPTIPEAIREHGNRFHKPARYVIATRGGDYFLYANDGEFLDIVFLS
jgi:hypothetical protein